MYIIMVSSWVQKGVGERHYWKSKKVYIISPQSAAAQTQRRFVAYKMIMIINEVSNMIQISHEWEMCEQT